MRPREHLGVLRLEVGERNRPALDLAAGSLAGQPQEHAARDRLLAGRKLGEGLLGEPGDGAADASGARVVGMAQPAAAAVLPELEQRRGEHGQGAGLALDVGDERVGQRRLDVQSRALGRAARRRAGARSARIGPTSTWFAASRSGRPGYAEQRP